MHGFRTWSIAVLPTTLLLLVARPAGADIYYVGNSLTAQASPNGIAHLAAQLGHDHARGYHIRCASGLDTIWNDPATTCVTPAEPFGTFTSALPNYDWDQISLQPYYDALDGETGTVERMADFVSLSRSAGRNAESKIYVYAAHPTRADFATFDFTAAWLAGYDPAVYDTGMTRDFFARALEGLRDHPDMAGGEVYMVPAGDVLAALDARMKAGEIPGFAAVNELYYDSAHLGRLGRWVEGMTFLSTIWGESPAGLAIPPNYSDFPLTPEQKMLFEQTVWEVVSTHQYTGVPEPASATALLGVALLALRRRRWA